MNGYKRDLPAYGDDFDDIVDLEYCENPYILKWWTPTHDQLLASKIQREQWAWHSEIFKDIEIITPKDAISAWRKEDPVCSKYAWYNVLMYFAGARAKKLGLTTLIRKPIWKICPLCQQQFIESSLPFPMVKRLGINSLDFCAPCLSVRIYQNTGIDTLSKHKVIAYLQELTAIIQQIPPQGFGERIGDFDGLTHQERTNILILFGDKPSTRCVKELFGSWLQALIEANILDDKAWRTSRGIHCIAKDGHICLSLGEKTIDDFLFLHGIHHTKEPMYPEENLRADFAVDKTFIEYFGLTGNAEYDSKTKRKQQLCKKNNIRLISIYPKDLVSVQALEKKLFQLLSIQ